jgi:NAD(P)-dependent dehydrogenase (short-subunit alcohol dehydrogenase family)
MSRGDEGRVAMISGANRGIGAAIAARLAADGWRLSFGIREPERVAAAPGAPDALLHRYDALDPASESAWVAATAARFGRIDAVVNNAGIMIAKSIVEASDADLDALLGVNVKAPLRLVRAAWPHLAPSGRGRVVSIVSLSGKRVKSARAGVYAMSKFAALALAHAIHHAGWDEGIRSTAICPGFVATDMARGLTDIDMNAVTQPAEVARIVALVLDLPNQASISEIPINWTLEEQY